ncbi:hypothetical protein PPL_05271 [Heterostelium album PN500]|uniref:Uncharacterized protein n=1 Tax=Heterostelium pallidum (strain ATCC 26659 / Pp 5 / PN500) TaxID=670386 RepID=D3BB85_HETP5|nr:hypothetical protein PPL_05271 [Heterostelium album PN500]EFA81292.1 hypothetical protein PPL_05271 [Heterostelium album PN500]|eukprot:XP_020433410.1 hypothetical protein PPL_05271 [Heterostelium album PN500]
MTQKFSKFVIDDEASSSDEDGGEHITINLNENA